MTTNKIASRVLRWLSMAGAGLLFAASAQAATGITVTKHNLSTTAGNPGVNKTTGSTDQICVFCHTPHGSDTSAAVPLWNKKLPGSTYQTYNSTAASATSTINGQILTVGSVSLACLSCHDGSQAMDNMMNAPGAGGYDAAGARPNAGAGWTWAGANQSSGLLNVATTASFIGTDLRNDHPIGIAYCGGGLTGTASAVAGNCSDSDFVGAVAGGATTTSDGRTGEVKTASINSKQVFWIDLPAHGVAAGAGDAKRGKQDIALYTRDFTSASGTPSVECGSCHDPHVETKGSDGINFMRVTTAGSKICLSCHVK